MSHPAIDTRLDSPDRSTEKGPGGDEAAAGSAWLDLHLRPFSRQSGRSRPFIHTGFSMQASALRERLRQPGSISVLRGERGIGRHTLLDYVVQELGDELRLLRLEIRPDVDLAATLRRRYPGSPDPGSALLEMIGGDEPSAARTVLVVDNAHLLGANDLDTLLERTKSAAAEAGIVLIAESSIERLISALDTDTAASLFTVSLLPLRRNQLPDYITHRLRAAGIYSRSPLGEAELRRVFRESGGVPGRVNEAARRVLEELYNSDHEDHGYGQVTGNPATTALLLSGALLLLTAGTWVWMNLDTREPVAPQAAASRPAQTTPRLPSGRAEVEPQGPAPVTEAAAALVSPTSPAIRDEPPSPGPAPEATAPAPPPSTTASSPMVETTPAATPAPTDAVEEHEQASAGSTDIPNDDGGLRGPQWLLSLPSDGYALQVVAVHDLAAIERLCDSIGGCGQAAWYAIERDGKTWYRLVVGPYQTLDEARSGIDELPAQLRNQKPWIRPMRDIHAAIAAGSHPLTAGN